MKKRTLKRILLGASGAAVAVTSGFQLARAYFEEPDFRTVSNEHGLELRRYRPRVVAETDVALPGRQAATSEGFSRLAEYIFRGNERIAMTTPVEATPVESKGQRIAMTAVEASPEDQGWRIVFTMPAKYRLEDLPEPRDSRVRLRREEGRLVAARRFSGRVTEATRRSEEAALTRRLERAGLQASGPVTVAIYDPPTTVLPFLRRNEVWVEVNER
ncbi:MAG: heme-binding protein [Myxococcota bacterium]